MINSQRGVNLLELLISLTLLGLILGIALPNYQALLERQRQIAELNRLQAISQMARTLASLHQQSLTLCPATGPQGCSPSRREAGLLLLDNDLNTIRYFPGKQTKIAFPEQAITFRPLPQRGVGGSLLPCSGFTQQSPKAITLSSVGRPRINHQPALTLINRCEG